MTRRLYVDTSAYLALLLRAPKEADALAAEMSGAQLVSSSLLVLEARRNIVRMGRERILTPEAAREALARVAQDASRFELRDLTLDICFEPGMPTLTTPRSLDLAHLLTATWFHRESPLTRFVTLDAAQRGAAAELGLPT